VLRYAEVCYGMLWYAEACLGVLRGAMVVLRDAETWWWRWWGWVMKPAVDNGFGYIAITPVSIQKSAVFHVMGQNYRVSVRTIFAHQRSNRYSMQTRTALNFDFKPGWRHTIERPREEHMAG